MSNYLTTSVKYLLLEMVNKFLLCVCVIFWEITNLHPDSGTDKYVKEAVNRSSSTD